MAVLSSSSSSSSSEAVDCRPGLLTSRVRSMGTARPSFEDVMILSDSLSLSSYSSWLLVVPALGARLVMLRCDGAPCRNLRLRL